MATANNITVRISGLEAMIPTMEALAQWAAEAQSKTMLTAAEKNLLDAAIELSEMSEDD